MENTKKLQNKAIRILNCKAQRQVTYIKNQNYTHCQSIHDETKKKIFSETLTTILQLKKISINIMQEGKTGFSNCKHILLWI